MDIDDEWELDESSDEEEEAGSKPLKIKEEVVSESESENQPAGAAALAPEILVKVEKLDPELDPWPSLAAPSWLTLPFGTTSTSLCVTKK